MVGQLGYGELIRKQFQPSKLLFHFLFWTFQWGIFAYGWWAAYVVQDAHSGTWLTFS